MLKVRHAQLYLPAYLHVAYQPIGLPACQRIGLPAYQPGSLLAYQPTFLPSFRPTNNALTDKKLREIGALMSYSGYIHLNPSHPPLYAQNHQIPP